MLIILTHFLAAASGYNFYKYRARAKELLKLKEKLALAIHKRDHAEKQLDKISADTIQLRGAKKC